VVYRVWDHLLYGLLLLSYVDNDTLISGNRIYFHYEATNWGNT